MASLLNAADGMKMTVDDEGAWLPLADALFDYDKAVEMLARVEYAKSSRARCRLCCEAIPKDSVKVGLPMKWQGKRCDGAPYGW